MVRGRGFQGRVVIRVNPNQLQAKKSVGVVDDAQVTAWIPRRASGTPNKRVLYAAYLIRSITAVHYTRLGFDLAACRSHDRYGTNGSIRSTSSAIEMEVSVRGRTDSED